MKIGFLFPGQGSQYVGMGKDLYEKYEEVRNIYDRVENLTGVNVKKISFEGPEEELNQTKNTQLCILTMSLAILEILNKNGVKAEVSAGLSLGEYSALIYSGILNFEDGVKLVQKRGEYMQNLVPDGEWLMSAILGMGENEVEEVCSKVQNMRKDKGFEVLDKINLYVSENEMLEELVKKFESEIKKETLTENIVFNTQRDTYTEVSINGEKLMLDVEVGK